MNIDDYIIAKFSVYYHEGQRFRMVVKNRDGEEFSGEGIYSGAGNWVDVNSFEKVFLPVFSTPGIPSGHYYDLKTIPLEHNPI